MTETHDSSLPEISLFNEPVAVRVKGTRRAYPIPAAGLVVATTDSVTIRDRDLRAFCGRLLGRSRTRGSSVDGAIDDLLAAIACRTPIALRGVSDLVPVAYALHRRILGPEHPFVVCDRRRREGDGSVRTPPSRRTCVLALEAAMDGSLCLRSDRLPSDFDHLSRSLREGTQVATVFVCLHDDNPVRDLWCRPLEIPPISAGAPEADRLLQESVDDAAAELGASSVQLPRAVRQDVLQRVTTFAELEKTALRVVALASARNISQAAARLGMAPVSLARWLQRRRWLQPILNGLEEPLHQADE